MDGTNPEDTLLKNTQALGALMNAWFDAGTKAAKTSSFIALDCLAAPVYDTPQNWVQNASARYAALANAWGTFFKDIASSLQPDAGSGSPTTGPTGSQGGAVILAQQGKVTENDYQVFFPANRSYPLTVQATVPLSYGPESLSLSISPTTISAAGYTVFKCKVDVPASQPRGLYRGTAACTDATGQQVDTLAPRVQVV